MTIQAGILFLECEATGRRDPLSRAGIERLAADIDDPGAADRFRSLAATLKIGETMGIPGRPGHRIRGEK